GTDKFSEVYSQGGSYQFKVGGAGLYVKVQDAVSNLGLAGLRVDAYEKLADGTQRWAAKRDTDGTGLAKFDLEGMGTGKVYVFKVTPYGFQVTSAEQSQTGWYTFKVGTSTVTLTDGATGLPIAGQSITALEKLPSGALVWAKNATTDFAGIIRFDLEGSNTGRVYVLRADNPFGDGVNYYSRLISTWGAIDFKLTQGTTNSPDTVPPTVQIISPDSTARVSRGGFKALGLASDDRSIKEVRLLVTLPDGSLVDKLATYDSGTGEWSVDSGAFADAAPGTLNVTVKALDNSYNAATASLDLELVIDGTRPVLTVLSHADMANVPMGGFLMSGVLTDDTVNPSLTALIEGGGLSSPITKPVEVAWPSGNWGVVVAPLASFTSANLKVTLTGVDGEGNATSALLTLQPSDLHQQAWHALSRTGFGAEPGLLASVVSTGVTNYLNQQINPEGVSDGAYTDRLAQWPAGTYMATDYMRRGVFSARRLETLLSWFWDNHFNTDYASHNNTAYEQAEIEGFRLHALGRFRDLLEVSATSPAMLTYLDGISNMMGAPNENYARELLELHTMGVDGGYSQQDVEEAARAFTGWTVKDGAFYFDSTKHDNGAKTVLGLSLPAGGGQSDGEAILDMLAAHPSTADFICSKLVTLLVDDVPVDGLISQCAAVFLANASASDQMRQVLWSILSSQEFLGTGHRLKKFKTPLEFGIGAARNLGLEADGDDLAAEMSDLGMPMFLQSVPTGYAETGGEWISTSLLLKRMNFLDRYVGDQAPDSRVFLKDALNALGAETQEAMVGRLLEWTLGPNYTATHFQWATDFLSNDGSRPYYNWADDAETRLRALGRALLSLPDSQYQ
ncbi:MAG: DUF1800 domain-containing protein, partial [Pseudomonadota bacterium]